MLTCALWVDQVKANSTFNCPLFHFSFLHYKLPYGGLILLFGLRKKAKKELNNVIFFRKAAYLDYK